MRLELVKNLATARGVLIQTSGRLAAIVLEKTIVTRRSAEVSITDCMALAQLTVRSRKSQTLRRCHQSFWQECCTCSCSGKMS